MITPVRMREFKPVRNLSHSDNDSSVIGVCDGGPVVAKPTSRLQLIREVLCNLLAQELRTPAPVCFVLKHASAPLHQSDPGRFWFGTEQLGRNYLRTLRGNLSNPPDLLAWPYLMDAIAFDAWIANGDRTLQNLLFLGQNKFALIDHGEALPPETDPNSNRPNLLTEHILQADPHINRSDLARRIIQAASRFQNADFSRIVSAALADGWGGNPEFIELCKLLGRRLEHLPVLIEAQLGTGQRSLWR